MSAQSSPHEESSRTDAAGSGLDRLRRYRCFGVATVEAIAFWSAVVLPLPTLLSLAGGLTTAADALVVLGLFSANLLAFVIGHGYRHSAVE